MWSLGGISKHLLEKVCVTGKPHYWNTYYTRYGQPERYQWNLLEKGLWNWEEMSGTTGKCLGNLENVCGPENYNTEPTGKGLGKLEDLNKTNEKVCGFESYHSGGTGKGLGNLEDVSAFNSTRTGTFTALSPSNGNGKQICQQHSLVFC